MKKFAWIIASLILVLISGCVSSQPTGGGENNNDEDISIPAYNGSAPSGFLDQLTWAGGGGGAAGSCNTCETYVLGGQATLQGFEPNQNVTLMFYRQTDGDSCGNYTASFVGAYTVQVDSNGSQQLSVSGMTDDIFLYGTFDAYTKEMLVGMPLGGKYPC